MTPHGAMGANSALESSACFVNNLLKLRDSTGSGLESISSTDASAVFEAYANQRRERVTGLKNMAGANERIQLRLGKEWEMFEKGLPVMPEHAIAVRILASVSHGEKLENWPVKTERTEKFDRNGQRALEAEKDGTLGELVAKLCADMGLD
jgi:2-polyprenyl-6-methoxyphenol hydroxylase-like FAD-dependent oxidoreductase